MQRHLIRITLALALGALASCDKAAEPEVASDHGRMRNAELQYMKVAASPSQRAGETGEAAVTPRRLAVRHDLQVQTSADAVESAYQTAQAACAEAGCELMSSQLSRDDERRPSQALLDVRVPQDKAAALLARFSAIGTVGSHQTSSEDKTDEVIDVDARLQNMAAFRDRLRVLMDKSGAKLGELIEVERELVRVQSELDSLTSRRKALASLTDKVRVVLSINARPAVLERGTWAPLHEALVGSGRMLAGSLAGLVSFMIAALPWLAVLLLTGWAVRAWRKRRRRGAA